MKNLSLLHFQTVFWDFQVSGFIEIFNMKEYMISEFSILSMIIVFCTSIIFYILKPDRKKIILLEIPRKTCFRSFSWYLKKKEIRIIFLWLDSTWTELRIWSMPNWKYISAIRLETHPMVLCPGACGNLVMWFWVQDICSSEADNDIVLRPNKRWRSPSLYRPISQSLLHNHCQKKWSKCIFKI